MYAGPMMIIIFAIGAMISLGSSLFIIFRTKNEGGGWSDMKSALYYAQSPFAIALVLAGVANAMLPPQQLKIAGMINPSVTDAALIEKGHHCLFERDGALLHPGIAETIPRFQDRFTSRNRFELQGQSITPVAREGIKKGFHIYAVAYTHLHYKSGEKIPLPKRSQRTFWVAHESCNAALRGDSNYGVFDPLSYINLNDWFGN